MVKDHLFLCNNAVYITHIHIMHTKGWRNLQNVVAFFFSELFN